MKPGRRKKHQKALVLHNIFVILTDGKEMNNAGLNWAMNSQVHVEGSLITRPVVQRANYLLFL